MKNFQQFARIMWLAIIAITSYEASQAFLSDPKDTQRGVIAVLILGYAIFRFVLIRKKMWKKKQEGGQDT